MGRDLFGLSIPQIIGKLLTKGARVKSLGSLDKFEHFMRKNLPFKTFEELIKCLYPSINITHIEPKVGLDLPPYDFTPEKIDSVIEESYIKTLEILAKKH